MKKVNGDYAMRRLILSIGIVAVWMLSGFYQCAARAEGELASVTERVREKIEFMRAEIAYLESEHGPEDTKWQNYKQQVEALAKGFEGLKALVDPAGKVAELEKKLADLHAKIPIRLPSGPKGSGRFGAYYVRLKYSLTWDKLWKVSDHPDVVVRFDESDHRFVFWRGTSYIPCWATYDGACTRMSFSSVAVIWAAAIVCANLCRTSRRGTHMCG